LTRASSANSLSGTASASSFASHRW
jgi:hypothetical protein